MAGNEITMRRTHRVPPPLSPVLLAGFALRPLPLAALKPFLSYAMDTILRHHPEIFDRLSDLNDPVYLIDPVDLPFRFVLKPDPLMPELTAIADSEDVEATATIRGSLITLIELLEGRIDGDAMFFSRDLMIEGDTEAVVALRNAVDGAEINVLADMVSGMGPLAGPIRLALEGAGALFSRAAEDMETLRAAVIAPALRRTEAQAADLRELEQKVEVRGRPRRRAASSVNKPNPEPIKS